MKKTSVRILLVALLISVVFAVPVFADGLVVPGLEMPKIVVSPTADNSTKFGGKLEVIGSAFPDEEISIDFDDPVIEDGEIVDDSDDNLTASVIADGNMAILLGIAAVAAGAVAVLVLKNRKVKKED